MPQEELQAIDTTAAPLTFREVAHLYAIHQLRDRPARFNFERCYRQFWQPWADRPVVTLTKKEVVVWLWGLTKTPGHANKARTFLRSMCNWAKRKALREELTAIRKYQEPDGRLRYLSGPEDAERLLQACEDWLRPIVLNALNRHAKERAIRVNPGT